MADLLIKGMTLPKECNVHLIIGEEGIVLEKIGSMYHVTTEAIELPPHEELISKASVISLLRYYCDMREYKKDSICEDCENRNACVVRSIMDEVNKLDTVLEAST